MVAISPIFTPYMERWHLKPEGQTIRTHSSRVLYVSAGNTPAVLKVALHDEEKYSGILMHWWNGKGAARVLAAHGDALLLERATGERTLRALAENGQDDNATAILCQTLATLHIASHERPHPEGLRPLRQWFNPLFTAATLYGGTLRECAKVAESLLASERDIVALHGDLHHGNVLDFRARGWLAVDPRNVRGERSFDYAKLFCNPTREVATRPGRIQRQLAIVCRHAMIDPRRMLQWIVAYAGLSAARMLQNNNAKDAQTKLEVARIALALLED